MVERELGRDHRDEAPVEERDESLSALSAGVTAEQDEAELQRVLEIGRKVMDEHHAVLAALAK